MMDLVKDDKIGSGSKCIDGVGNINKEGQHISYCKVEVSFAISETAIHSILYEHLAIKKNCTRFIPQNLTEVKKKARWV